MLFAIQYEVKDQLTIMDILKPKDRDFKFFTSGSLNFIFKMIGGDCGACRKCGSSVDDISQNTKDLFLIYSLEDKMKAFELLETLTSKVIIQVQTLKQMAEFTDRNKIVCEKCREPLKRAKPMPPMKVTTKSKASFVSEEEAPAAKKGSPEKKEVVECSSSTALIQQTTEKTSSESIKVLKDVSNSAVRQQAFSMKELPQVLNDNSMDVTVKEQTAIRIQPGKNEKIVKNVSKRDVLSKTVDTKELSQVPQENKNMDMNVEEQTANIIQSEDNNTAPPSLVHAKAKSPEPPIIQNKTPNAVPKETLRNVIMKRLEVKRQTKPSDGIKIMSTNLKPAIIKNNQPNAEVKLTEIPKDKSNKTAVKQLEEKRKTSISHLMKITSENAEPLIFNNNEANTKDTSTNVSIEVSAEKSIKSSDQAVMKQSDVKRQTSSSSEMKAKSNSPQPALIKTSKPIMNMSFTEALNNTSTNAVVKRPEVKRQTSLSHEMKAKSTNPEKAIIKTNKPTAESFTEALNNTSTNAVVKKPEVKIQTPSSNQMKAKLKNPEPAVIKNLPESLIEPLNNTSTNVVVRKPEVKNQTSPSDGMKIKVKLPEPVNIGKDEQIIDEKKKTFEESLVTRDNLILRKKKKFSHLKERKLKPIDINVPLSSNQSQPRTEVFYRIKAMMQEEVKQLRMKLNLPEKAVEELSVNTSFLDKTDTSNEALMRNKNVNRPEQAALSREQPSVDTASLNMMDTPTEATKMTTKVNLPKLPAPAEGQSSVSTPSPDKMDTPKEATEMNAPSKETPSTNTPTSNKIDSSSEAPKKSKDVEKDDKLGKKELEQPHESIKDMDPNYAQQCTMCNVILKVKVPFNMRRSIATHVRCHLDFRPYSCKKCNYACRYNGRIAEHMKFRHPNERTEFFDNSRDAAYSVDCLKKAKECFPSYDYKEEKHHVRKSILI